MNISNENHKTAKNGREQVPMHMAAGLDGLQSFCNYLSPFAVSAIEVNYAHAIS
jgi:hypothetical protein